MNHSEDRSDAYDTKKIQKEIKGNKIETEEEFLFLKKDFKAFSHLTKSLLVVKKAVEEEAELVQLANSCELAGEKKTNVRIDVFLNVFIFLCSCFQIPAQAQSPSPS